MQEWDRFAQQFPCSQLPSRHSRRVRLSAGPNEIPTVTRSSTSHYADVARDAAPRKLVVSSGVPAVPARTRRAPARPLAFLSAGRSREESLECWAALEETIARRENARRDVVAGRLDNCETDRPQLSYRLSHFRPVAGVARLLFAPS